MDERRWANLMAVPAVVALLCLTSGPLYRVRTWWSSDDPLSADPAIVLIHAAFGVAAAAWLVTGGRWRALDRRALLVAGVLGAWILLGSTWSFDRTETLRQGLQLTSSFIVGAAAVVALGGAGARLALWAALHIGLAWSVAAIYLDRSGTIDQNGDWTGVYFNRNSLALYAALGVLVTAFVAADRRRAPSGRSRAALEVLVLIGAGVVDVRLIAGSDALTPLGALVAAAAAVAVAVGGRRLVARGAGPGRLVAAAGVVAVVGGAVAWATRGAWLDRLGRESDLTGRSDIWDVALDWAWRRPFHGFGYFGLWDDPAFVAEVEAQRGAVVGSAHNAFIDMFLGAGLVGLTLLCALVAVLYQRHGVDAVTTTGLASAFSLAVVVFVTVENLTETLIVGNQLVVALLGWALLAGGRGDYPAGRVAQPPSRFGGAPVTPGSTT